LLTLLSFQLMLNDPDLQKAAEDMLNNDAHDEVRKIIFLTVFFPKLTIHFKIATSTVCLLIICITGSIKSYFPS